MNFPESNGELFFNITEGCLIPESELQLNKQNVAVPLAQLILSKDFSYTYGDFGRTNRTWTPEKSIEQGSMIVDYFRSQGHDKFNTPLFQKLITLGLQPHFSYIKYQFGSLRSYRHLIGANSPMPSTDFAHLSTADILECVRVSLIDADINGPLTVKFLQSEYKKGILPGYGYFRSRYGGLGEVNTLLGYPNFKEWEEADYIHTGGYVT